MFKHSLAIMEKLDNADEDEEATLTATMFKLNFPALG